MSQSYSRRGALKAAALAMPALAGTAAQAQTSAERELAAAEQELNTAIQQLHAFPLPTDAESSAVFRAQ